jgi:hypothetical protein
LFSCLRLKVGANVLSRYDSVSFRAEPASLGEENHLGDPGSAMENESTTSPDAESYDSETDNVRKWKTRKAIGEFELEIAVRENEGRRAANKNTMKRVVRISGVW